MADKDEWLAFSRDEFLMGVEFWRGGGKPANSMKGAQPELATPRRKLERGEAEFWKGVTRLGTP